MISQSSQRRKRDYFSTHWHFQTSSLTRVDHLYDASITLGVNFTTMSSFLVQFVIGTFSVFTVCFCILTFGKNFNLCLYSFSIRKLTKKLLVGNMLLTLTIKVIPNRGAHKGAVRRWQGCCQIRIEFLLVFDCQGCLR